MDIRMVDNKHGEMDIEEQEKTFEGFLRLSGWVVIISIVTLIFVALINV